MSSWIRPLRRQYGLLMRSNKKESARELIVLTEKMKVIFSFWVIGLNYQQNLTPETF